MHRANRDGTIAWRSSGQTLTAARLATSTQRQNDDRVEVEAGREEEAAVRAGNWLARRGQPAATFCRRACLPKSESDSKCTEWVPPTVGKSPMGARRIQRAMKAQIAPPKAAVEARTCAWAGRARYCGVRPGAARLAPSAERRFCVSFGHFQMPQHLKMRVPRPCDVPLPHASGAKATSYPSPVAINDAERKHLSNASRFSLGLGLGKSMFQWAISPPKTKRSPLYDRVPTGPKRK